MNLQELVARARLLFNGAPKRKHVFDLVNGKNSAKDIAKKTGKSLAATLNDLLKMKDLEIILLKKDELGQPLKKDGSLVYEQAPALRHLPATYFSEPDRVARTKPKTSGTAKAGRTCECYIRPFSKTDTRDLRFWRRPAI
jgi:hypothetical protein